MAVLDTSIMLVWDAPPPHQQNGVITGYTITQRVAGNVSTLTSRDSMLLVDGLRPFTSYTFEVAASTSVGLGPATAPLVVQTQQAGKRNSYSSFILVSKVPLLM